MFEFTLRNGYFVSDDGAGRHSSCRGRPASFTSLLKWGIMLGLAMKWEQGG